MTGPVQPGPGAVARPQTAIDDRALGWIGRLFGLAALVGLAAFGVCIALRVGGATVKIFEQWQTLVAGRPMITVSELIADIGIRLHFAIGTVLVMAWPTLLSARIRTRHRKVHRWTGRIYVAAGLLAGADVLSFLATHGSFSRAAGVAFSMCCALMMFSAVMANVHARARRFNRHRAWAIRLFAVVVGSWLFDIEIRAWTDWAGGVGMHADTVSGPFDPAMFVLFFVPNLLVAEFLIRNMHGRLALPGRLKWLAVAALGAVGLVLAHAIVMASATHAGEFGKHLLPLVGA